MNQPDELEQPVDQAPLDEDVTFICPNCGKISRDDVVFLCNVCKQEDLIEKEGLYMCPACLNPGDNFECMICESKEVKMKERHHKGK
ncbi:hypothetical protein KAZ57_01730 [Patescibacteria group bacterium]|nr:hypothetical protein [Patescibacteria group bacterium]